MSRIGSNPVLIPDNVQVTTSGMEISVTGPLGDLSMTYLPQVTVEIVDGKVIVARKKEDKFSKSVHGLTRALIANMVIGVKKGWEKKLELVGVGFRAQLAGEKLTLNVGYSHSVEIEAPSSIKFNLEDNTKITVSGISKALVGQIAAKIRAVRPPEPYQGKGIRYFGEYVRRKAGKAGKAVTK